MTPADRLRRRLIRRLEKHGRAGFTVAAAPEMPPWTVWRTCRACAWTVYSCDNHKARIGLPCCPECNHTRRAAA